VSQPQAQPQQIQSTLPQNNQPQVVPNTGMNTGGMGVGGMPQYIPNLQSNQGQQGGENPFGNPMMRQAMESMMSNPQMMENLINTNPQLSQMASQNPQVREMLRNPQMMRQAMAMMDDPA